MKQVKHNLEILKQKYDYELLKKDSEIMKLSTLKTIYMNLFLLICIKMFIIISLLIYYNMII